MTPIGVEVPPALMTKPALRKALLAIPLMHPPKAKEAKPTSPVLNMNLNKGQK